MTNDWRNDWRMTDWGTLTQAQRDARYNNTDAVPNSQDLVAELREASAKVREAFPDHLDLPYGDTERRKIDLFPAEDPAAPTLFFIHGGYWQRNSREGFSALGDGVRAHGWSVAMPSYTLTPDGTMTNIVDEIRMALDFTRTKVQGPIIVSGWSAGGHLTAMVLDHPAVHAGLAISGVFELGPVRDTYLNEKARITETEMETLSPLRHPVCPKPLSFAYGSAELPPLVSDSRDLHAKRAAAHAPGALIPGPGDNHFTIIASLRQKHGLLTKALLDLV
jgi:acetyl esterase/lipase